MKFTYTDNEEDEADVAPRSGVRGLKSSGRSILFTRGAVAPRSGVRGLKFICSLLSTLFNRCRTPLRGAWIEMSPARWLLPLALVAPRSGVRGLKCRKGRQN